MCPADDSHLTYDFGDHFVISPSITFTVRNNDFNENLLGEKGVNMVQGTEYSSGTNPHFLSIKELVEFNKSV